MGHRKYAIFCHPGYGPTFGFGGGHDLHICDNPQVNQSHINFGHTYQLPSGYVYNSEQAKNLFAGQYQFLTTEIEVFNWKVPLFTYTSTKNKIKLITTGFGNEF